MNEKYCILVDLHKPVDVRKKKTALILKEGQNALSEIWTPTDASKLGQQTVELSQCIEYRVSLCFVASFGEIRKLRNQPKILLASLIRRKHRKKKKKINHMSVIL